MPLACVFFDLGNTLGSVGADHDLQLYADTVSLLRELREIGLRLGVISNVPPVFTDSELRSMLADAGIDEYFDPTLVITRDGDGAGAIFERAATAAGVSIGECAFIGADDEP
jgi:FMN phosphatase YigB (HAD superfamily)